MGNKFLSYSAIGQGSESALSLGNAHPKERFGNAQASAGWEHHQQPWKKATLALVNPARSVLCLYHLPCQTILYLIQHIKEYILISIFHLYYIHIVHRNISAVGSLPTEILLVANKFSFNKQKNSPENTRKTSLINVPVHRAFTSWVQNDKWKLQIHFLFSIKILFNSVMNIHGFGMAPD